MTITLELPPHLEGMLRASVTRGDAAAIQRLLAEAFIPTVTALLHEPPARLSDAEFEALADQLTDEWEADGGPTEVVQADEAMSREDIYEEHP